MDTIFISYRREDSSGYAGRIFDRLRDAFGTNRVFMDVSAIEPGVDFVEAIDHAVGSCAVLIVVIGKKWLTCTDAAGRRRLDDPQDFIRLETATALRRNIRVIPVLVQAADMPRDEDLPEELKKLARRQATEISDSHWDTDMGQLIVTLRGIVGGGETIPDTGKAASKGSDAVPPPSPPSPLSRMKWLITSITAVVIALGGLLSSVESVRNTVARFIGISGPPPAQMVTVPSLVGLRLEQAVEQLGKVQLIQGTVQRRVVDQPAGTVIAQAPEPGKQAPPESRIDLVVADKRPEPQQPHHTDTTPVVKPDLTISKVPTLIGRPLEEAVALLKKAGFAAGEIEKRETGDASPDTVVGQSPEAGVKLGRGARVLLVVAAKPREPEQVTVPDLGKMPLKRAVMVLEKAGLQPGTMTTRDRQKASDGTVIDQRPHSGEKVLPGTKVNLLVEPPAAKLELGNEVPPPVSTVHRVIARGNLDVRENGSFDLDSGRMVKEKDVKADLAFLAKTETIRYLYLRNGASAGIILKKGDYENCSQAKMSIKAIPIEKLPVKGAICVRTSSGHLAAFMLREPLDPGQEILKIFFVTWE